MVRNHKRTTEKAKWTEESLTAGIEMVRSGTSVKSVAINYKYRDQHVTKSNQLSL